MYYYDVYPADRGYQSREALTYHHTDKLQPGQIIVVKLKTKQTYAVVKSQVDKPSFNTLNIEDPVAGFSVPAAQLSVMQWMMDYYPSSTGSIVSLFVPSTLLVDSTKQSPYLQHPPDSLSILPTLTDQQRTILHDILSSQVRSHIIHGDTGTGKTRLYIELARTIIEQQKSVLILTPEISLTPQLERELKKVFPRVIVSHSRLTTSQRRIIWRTVATSREPLVVIGPRSSLFYPFSDLGLIILDEFHDGSYKQEQSPRYQASRVAAVASKAYGAKLVMGSATPPVDTYFYAKNKGASIHRLTEKPNKATHKTSVRLVDISSTQERTSHPLLSKSLCGAIAKSIESGHQVMLFLNRRGSARKILCEQCGWKAVCERCNSNYIYHRDAHAYVCHVCGRHEAPLTQCPECKHTNLIYNIPGTKAIQEAIVKLFPDVIIGRYDKDNKKIESFSENHEKISAGEVNILIGTQLLTKGHDLPKLGLVGILLVEDSYRFPDYTAEENTFQLLHQIAGRLGRHDIPGTIIAQTFKPQDKYTAYLSQEEDAWTHFYNDELQQRKKFHFPPYYHLMSVEVSRKTEKSAEQNIVKIYKLLEKHEKEYSLELLGPAPALYQHSSGEHRWQIIVKSQSRSKLLSVIDKLPKSCTYNIDPQSLL